MTRPAGCPEWCNRRHALKTLLLPEPWTHVPVTADLPTTRGAAWALTTWHSDDTPKRVQVRPDLNAAELRCALQHEWFHLQRGTALIRQGRRLEDEMIVRRCTAEALLQDFSELADVARPLWDATRTEVWWAAARERPWKQLQAVADVFGVCVSILLDRIDPPR